MKILTFGEILWDQFEDKKEIGGASLNFSAHLAKLGAQVQIVSAIGNDFLGHQTLELINTLNIGMDYIFISSYPTGVCNVSTNQDGFPIYNLLEGVAYDNIILEDGQLEQINKEFDIFYFGTLSQRSEVSRNTLNTILSNCRFNEVFCDLNIRQLYYNVEVVENCLNYSTILKFSREECYVFEKLKIVPIKRTDYENELIFLQALCEELTDHYHIKIIIITRDKDGSMLFYPEKKEVILSKKPKNMVVSTVGAGDSFSACFLYNYLQKVNLEECVNRAVELSDFVVTKLGAVPEYPIGLLENIKNNENK